jgi:pyridoxine 4-dehydrogenase
VLASDTLTLDAPLGSPNVLLIPGTSSVQHLRENLFAAALTLPAPTLAKLNGVAAESE